MQIIGVRFKKAGKIFFFEPNEEEIIKGDWILVETSRGLECGKVVVGARELLADENIESEPGLPLTKIYRKATEEDLKQLEENQADEKRAFATCQEKIREHDLPMKLINVEFTFDVNKMGASISANWSEIWRRYLKPELNCGKWACATRQNF